MIFNCIIKKQTKFNQASSGLEEMLFISPLCGDLHEREADITIPIIAQRPAVIMTDSHSL